MNEKLELYAFALPVGKLIPGFLVPIVSGQGKFFVQVTTEKKVAKFEELALGGRDDGPLLQLKALKAQRELSLVFCGPLEITVGKPPVEAFFDGCSIFIGNADTLAANMRQSMRATLYTLQTRPFAVAGLLDFIGEGQLASKVRSGKTVQVPELLARFDVGRIPSRPRSTTRIKLNSARHSTVDRHKALSDFGAELESSKPFYEVHA